MGKVNYQHLKRLKEAARKNRQQEKLDRRAPAPKESTATSSSTPDATTEENVTAVPGNALP